jgi:glyoxylase I family protein
VNDIDKIQEELRALELALLQPATRKDAHQLTQLLTEDFIEVGSVGAAFTRDQIIAGLLRESPTEWTVENLKARALGDGVVLVTYRASRLRHGERVDSLRSSIWKREAGRWRMTFHQGTLARD